MMELTNGNCQRASCIAGDGHLQHSRLKSMDAIHNRQTLGLSPEPCDEQQSTSWM